MGRMISVSKVRTLLNTLQRTGGKTDTASNTTNTALRPFSMKDAMEDMGQGKSLRPRTLLGPCHSVCTAEEARIRVTTLRWQRGQSRAPSLLLPPRTPGLDAQEGLGSKAPCSHDVPEFYNLSLPAIHGRCPWVGFLGL